MNLRNLFSDSRFNSKLFHLALPIAFQNFMLACVAASDTIMLGSLEQNAMSAVSLASQIQFVQNVTVTGVIAAFQILGAQYAGKNDKKTVDKLFCMSLRICVLVSLLFSLLCFFIPVGMMKIFTNEEVLKRARYIVDRKVFDKEKLLETIPEFENTDRDPDVTIYGSFLSRDDKKRLAEVRKLPPSAKLSHHPSLPFDDEKYHKLVWRQVARNWPEVLSDSDRKKWKN